MIQFPGKGREFMAETIAELQARITALLATVVSRSSQYRLREINERLSAMLSSPAQPGDPGRVAGEASSARS
jgi:hypothetical protein